MEVKQLQELIVEKRLKLGFVSEPVKLCNLLTEEVGELASEIKKTWTHNYGKLSKKKISEECADVCCVLIAIAQEFNIDIEEAVIQKFISHDEVHK